MELFIKITQFLASFSLLVIIHELGHFLFARMFGMRVEKFYLFFNWGFSLFKFKKGNTEYGIGWIPFGGYVKIAGMIDESMDREQMVRPPQPDEFRSKPAWQRLLVMTGGVIMNVLLAIIIYIGMSFNYGDRYISNNDLIHGYTFNELAREIGFENGDRIVSLDGKHVDNYAMVYPEMVIGRTSEVEILRKGEPARVVIPENYTAKMLESYDFMEPRLPFVVGATVEGGGAEAAGLRQSDSLVALNGVSMAYFDEYSRALEEYKGTTVELTIIRDDERITLPVEVSEEGKIGVYPLSLTAYVPIQVREYTLGESVGAGIKKVGSEIKSYWKQVKLLFSPKTEAYKSLGGVISIGSIFPEYWSWEVFWRITAFLSIILAVMNILPIPALDGGHVLFLLYEVIARRKPSDKFMEAAQITGTLLIFGLIIFATSNDIYRFFIK